MMCMILMVPSCIFNLMRCTCNSKMLSFFKHSRVFRNHPIFLKFGVSLPPSHLLDHSTAGLSWNNDFLVQILWGISFQTWLLWVYVTLPGNQRRWRNYPKRSPTVGPTEKRTPKKTKGIFWLDRNLLGSVGIRSHSIFGGLQGTSPYFLKTSGALFEMKKSFSRLMWYVILSWWNSFLGEKAGRESWRNHYESLMTSGCDHGFCGILLWNQSCCKSSTRIHLQPGF